MANLHHSIILLLIFTFSAASTATAAKPTFARETAAAAGPEKQTALHFYLTDLFAGPNRTALLVTEVLDNSTYYGGLYMTDDPLTSGLHLNSTRVGKGHGLYGFPARTDTAIEMLYTLTFHVGKYNGSKLSMMGTIDYSSVVNELAVVGGTGVFRFARGYVVAKRVFLDFKQLLIVREMNVYVSHY